MVVVVAIYLYQEFSMKDTTYHMMPSRHGLAYSRLQLFRPWSLVVLIFAARRRHLSFL